MKNVKNLFGMAVMATALVGCSSNDNLNPNANDNGGKTGEAYASFKINLPTTTGNGTRGDEPVKDGTPSFAEGTAAEYEVKNGTILIFDAKTDKFVTSADLGTMNPWTDVKKDGVTTSAIATVKLSNVSVNGNYNALVLLNNNTKTNPKVKMPTASDTYASWSANADNTDASEYVKTDGIFMANAPEYSATSEPTTLVKINHVCASPEEAQAKAATVVYVERGLAKVTMEDFSKTGYSVGAGTYEGGNVKIENWQLDVTNKSTFPVHQTGTLKDSWADIWSTPRFYDGDNKTFKRVYWGVDPNYNEAKYQVLANCQNAFNMIKNKDVTGVAGKANPQYCLENTFDLDNMKQGQTTRVVFKAVFTPKDFTSKYKTFYKIGNNTTIWSQENLENQIHTVAVTVMGITDATEQGNYKVKLDASTNNISATAGLHKITADNIEYKGTGTSLVAANIDKINEKLGLTETGISTYLNGEAYYIARIKHFNELTPWKAGQAYTDNKSFLGRYGVLRNNWYELSVNKVSGLGYPDVPEVKPTVPDDENDQYINVEVKILDWAMRKQVIDL